MVPEPAVLHRDRGGRQVGRHVGQPQRIADDVAEGGEHVAGAVLQRQAGPARGVQRGLRTRQVAREPQQHDGERQHAPDRGDDGVAQQAEAPAPRDGYAAQRCAGARGRAAVVGSEAGGTRHRVRG